VKKENLKISIGLLAKIKEKGATLDADTEKSMKLLEESLEDCLKSLKEGEDSESDAKFAEFLTQYKALEAKNADIEKSMREIGFDVLKINKWFKDKATPTAKFYGSFEEALREKMAEDESFNWGDEKGIGDDPANFSSKEGKKGFKLTVKAPTTMLQSSNIEPNANTILPVPFLVPGVNLLLRNRPAIWDYVDKGRTDSPLVAWVNEYNKQGDAAFTSEGAAAPLASFELQVESTPTQEIIVKEKVSRKMLKSIPFMADTIEKTMMLNFYLTLNSQLLSGNGVAPNINGITKYAPAFTTTALNGSTDFANIFDAIDAAKHQILTYSDQAAPNVIFMNPLDHYSMIHAKTSTANYIDAIQEVADKGTLWGMKVVESNNIPAGYFLVGDFTKFMVKIWEDMKIEYVWENDDATKRLVTVILYMDVASYVSNNNVGLFVYDTYANVITAIQKA